MMIRITYISKLTKPLSIEEIKGIGAISSKNNKQVNITGLLVYFEKLFFQVLEGDEKEVDRLYTKIGKDKRHGEVIRLSTEYDVEERLFPSWSMNLINLDDSTDDLMRPIKILLRTLVESHSIVERYTQPTILKTLNKGINPLKLSPVRIERIILFADLVSYSTISEKWPMESMVQILNTFFEVCTSVILSKGGEVNKFMGDGLMAYFDIEKADDAIHACLEIKEKLRALRENSLEYSPLQILYTGFGLAQGLVIEGNMGSAYKTDYTIIGDPVNVAARLQALTRETNYSLILSGSLKNNTKESWPFIGLGTYKLKGMENNNEVYSIDHDLFKGFNKSILAIRKKL